MGSVWRAAAVSVMMAALLAATAAIPPAAAYPYVDFVDVYPNPANQGDTVFINASASVQNSSGYIAAMEYHVDDPSPTGGTGTPMTAWDGAFNEASEGGYAYLYANLTPGDHTICVLAKEQNGNNSVWSSCGSTILTILGAPQFPVADAGPDQVVLVAQTLTFDGNGSYDPDGYISSYFWLFGDGTWDFGVVVAHAYSAAGVYTVILEVMDNDSQNDTDTATVTINDPGSNNTAPVADAGPDQAGTVGQPLTFDSNGSYDPDGFLISYDWDLGDGVFDNGAIVAHAFSSAGVYTVTLTVTDDGNLTDSDTALVTITNAGNQLPLASAGPDQSDLVGQTLTFNGNGSSDPDGFLISHDWDFGDGASGSGIVVTHAYLLPGLYTVTLTVMDDGNLTDSDTALADITGTFPMANAGGPYAGRKNFALGLDGTGSVDDVVIMSYVWDFGDGQVGSGAAPSHTYATGGVFTVTLTVTDDLGLTDTDMTTATIEDRLPGAPTMLPAVLTGGGLAHVRVRWTLSSDDGGAEDDVSLYEILSGTNYDASGASYTFLASVAAGTTSYVNLGAGSGDPQNHFYVLRAVEEISGRAVAAADQAGKFTRFLIQGKQLVSVPLELQDWYVGSVFQTISWSRVRTFANIAGHGHNWHSNQHQKPWQDLTLLTRKMAAWVEVESDGHWAVAGLVPKVTEVTLKTGWNFIGYASFADRSVGQVLAGINYQTVEGYAYDPPHYLRRMAASDLMRAGNGFWIHISMDATLTLGN